MLLGLKPTIKPDRYAYIYMSGAQYSHKKKKIVGLLYMYRKLSITLYFKLNSLVKHFSYNPNIKMSSFLKCCYAVMDHIQPAVLSIQFM